MSNKELRNALFKHYRVTMRNQWPFFFLLVFYYVYAIYCLVARSGLETRLLSALCIFLLGAAGGIFALEITGHQKAFYIVPISYEERKRYSLIGILSNFTVNIVWGLLFLLVSLLINKEIALQYIRLYAIIGIPYNLFCSIQKTTIYKGKRTKDNPKRIYASMFLGGAVGFTIVFFVTRGKTIFLNEHLFALFLIVNNLVSSAFLLFSCFFVMRGNTDYENLRLKELKIMKKLV